MHLPISIFFFFFLYNRALLDLKKEWCIDFMGTITKTKKKGKETKNLQFLLCSVQHNKHVVLHPESSYPQGFIMGCLKLPLLTD